MKSPPTAAPAPAQAKRPQQLIGSFDKGLQILDLVVTAGQPLRLQDIANSIRIDKSSASRFMATLQKHGLVDRDPRDKTFSVGTRLLMWSSNFKAGNTIVAKARPHLLRLTQMTHQTSHLAMLRDGRVVLMDGVSSDSAIAVRQPPGDSVPLHASAVGKAILAFLPLPEQQLLLERIDAREVAHSSPGSGDRLRDELRQVMRARLAYDEAETIPHVSGIAAPVLDRSGYPVASIGIATIAALYPRGIRHEKALADAVRQIADEVSQEIDPP